MTDELKLMLPELNVNQLKYLDTYIALKVAEAEKAQMVKDAEMYRLVLPTHSDHYTFTPNDYNDFIANWLNDENDNYQDYVKGVKLFKEYLLEKMTDHNNERNWVV